MQQPRSRRSGAPGAGRRVRPLFPALTALLCAALAAPGLAQIELRPQAAEVPPPRLAVVGVRVGLGDEAPERTLLLADGRIAEVLEADAEVPPGHLRIDGAGLRALPAFLDAFTTSGIEVPALEADRDRPLDVQADVWADMRVARRKGLRPAFRAVDHLDQDAASLAAYRRAGFGYAAVGAGGEILSGQAALVSLRDAAPRDRVLLPEAASHASFGARGGGYPSTLMGRFAHLRQFHLDAARQAELAARFAAGRAGPRPAYDPDLEAAARLARGETLVLCEAEGARDIRRWLRLGEELGWRMALLGGREAGREAERLAARGVPVVLGLRFGREPEDPRETGSSARPRRSGSREAPAPEEEDEDPEQESADGEDEEESEPPPAPEAQDEADGGRAEYRVPHGARLEARLEWERDRDGALALVEAGVPLAFATLGDAPGEWLGRVRGLVERGLAPEAALAALTEGPARLYGLEGRVGVIAAGADASLMLWSGDPLVDGEARVRWAIVDGYPEKIEPEERAPARGGRR